MSGKKEKLKRKEEKAGMLAVLEEAAKRNEAYQKELHLLCDAYGKEVQAGVQACLIFLDSDEKKAPDPAKNKEFAEKLRELCLKHEMQPEARLRETTQGTFPYVIVVDHRKIEPKQEETKS